MTRGVQKTNEIFLLEARRVHGDRYSYRRPYVNSCQKLVITCSIDGDFFQTPHSHLRGEGCPKCGYRDRSAKAGRDFVAKARLVHGDRYGYDRTIYIGSRTRLLITCAVHGDFSQMPYSHVNGRGCKLCRDEFYFKERRSTMEQFVRKARAVHGERYNYIGQYVASDRRIEIECLLHGEFMQTPGNHLNNGTGCPECACASSISKPSTAWLDALGIIEREVNLNVKGRRGRVDGYDPATQTEYQFHGDYFHGNPEVFAPDQINPTIGRTFGELFEKTMLRDQLLRDAGYTVVVMWENDWNQVNANIPSNLGLI